MLTNTNQNVLKPSDVIKLQISQFTITQDKYRQQILAVEKLELGKLCWKWTEL